ncbi:MAG: MFS transporter [Planctomycetota bacterium]
MAEPQAQQAPPAQPEKFPKVFWIANVTELFERGAYYAMAWFVTMYLGQLGLGNYWPSTLNSVLWTLIYFLPILSGTIADQIGFRKALLGAFVLLSAGYFLMGFPVWFGGAELKATIEDTVTAGPGIVVPVVLAIVIIGIGGSFVKPCILGTAQKSAGTRATLAFAIFYMVVNMGSLFGRGFSYLIRTQTTKSYVFAAATACTIAAFFIVAFLYRDPETMPGSKVPVKPKKSVRRILLDMVLVLRNLRFTLFLLVMSGFWFLYTQVYNVLPLYLKKVVEVDPDWDLYSAANPIVIVCFQLLVTKLFGKMKPVRSIIVGCIIIGISMAINLLPLYTAGGVQVLLINWLPIGSVFAIMTVALIAFGELFTSARTFEYIGALAPKGQEGLFLGYANLPTAIGALAGGPVGAAILNEIMCKNATKLESGLLELDPGNASLGWLVFMAIGFGTAAGLWVLNRWLEKQEARAA